MPGGDVILTWRPQNIVSIVLMVIGASFVLVLGRQLYKRVAGTPDG